MKTTELFWDSFGLFRFLYILQNGDTVYAEIGFIEAECGAGIKQASPLKNSNNSLDLSRGWASFYIERIVERKQTIQRLAASLSTKAPLIHNLFLSFFKDFKPRVI